MNIDLIHLSRPCSTIFPSPILSSIGFTVSFSVWDHIYFPAKGYLQIIADSAQTEYCSTFHFPSVCRRDISHFSNVYRHICHMSHQRIRQIIHDSSSLTRPPWLPRSPWLFLPNLTTLAIKQIHSESALITQSCLFLVFYYLFVGGQIF